MIERLTCKHCRERLYRRPGSSGRYALTTCGDGTDVLGSGSECRANERGHELLPSMNNAVADAIGVLAEHGRRVQAVAAEGLRSLGEAMRVERERRREEARRGQP